jgi:hypothetical protein
VVGSVGVVTVVEIDESRVVVAHDFRVARPGLAHGARPTSKY